MIAALITIATGLSGAFGFILLVFIVTWLVTRHDHDYDNEPNELEQAKETFARTGSLAAYRRMLSLVTAPDVLTWYNSADEDDYDRAKRDWRKANGVRVVDAETQAMWSGMVEATEYRSGGIIVSPNDYRVEFPELPGALSPYPCDCNACRIVRGR